MNLDDITPMILTLNEAANIGRTLSNLDWAKDIVVVDSFSVDETVSIARTFPNARVVSHAFESQAGQWNFALKETEIETEWILALDADYVLSAGFVDELRTLDPQGSVAGFRAAFVYCIDGKPLRGSAYPPVAVLFRRQRAEFYQDGHTHRARIDGEILDLRVPLLHDDRKPLQHWLLAQGRYMRLEAAKLRAADAPWDLKSAIRRLIVVAPPLMFLYCLFVKGNILDGRAGLFYALQRALAEALLSLYLLQRDEDPRR